MSREVITLAFLSLRRSSIGKINMAIGSCEGLLGTRGDLVSGSPAVEAVRWSRRAQAGKARTALLWIMLVVCIVASVVVINWIERWLNIDIGWW